MPAMQKTTQKNSPRKPAPKAKKPAAAKKQSDSDIRDAIHTLLKDSFGPASFPTIDSTEQTHIRQFVEGMRKADGVEYRVEATPDGKRVLVSKPAPAPVVPAPVPA